MDIWEEYRQKLCTPEQAVQAVHSGDWVDYTTSVGFPELLDRALAGRKEELQDVKVRGNLMFGPLEIVECDPEREHFIYNTWHCSAYERKLCDRGLCNYIPMIFRDVVSYYRKYLTVNVAMAAVTPMDKHGYFNFSGATGVAGGILEQADIVILEVNEHLPRIPGIGESIHISQVDHVVEGPHRPLPQLPAAKPTEAEEQIARHILPHLQRCDLAAGDWEPAGDHWNAVGTVRSAGSGNAHGALLRRLLGSLRGRETDQPKKDAVCRQKCDGHCLWQSAAV